MLKLRRSLLALLALGLSALPAAAQLRTLDGFAATMFAGDEDASVGPVSLGFTIDFNGPQVSAIYVNFNGSVTFSEQLPTYAPYILALTDTPIIAPFFADAIGDAGSIVNYGQGTLNGRDAFAVNWINVLGSGLSTAQRNTFQVVIIDRSDVGPGDFDFELNYGAIQWDLPTTAGAIGARIGFSNALSLDHEELGSGDAGSFLSNDPRRLEFQVRNNAVPEASTYGMIGAALLAAMIVTRRWMSRISAEQEQA